jgi:hypothetical protein
MHGYVGWLSILISGGFACGVEACSSDTFTASPSTDDGGAEGSTPADSGGSDSGGDSGAPGCLLSPAATGGEKAFCDYYAAAYSRCGDCQPCRQADVNNCIVLGDALSENFKAAVIACAAEETCAEVAKLDFGTNPCVQAALALATPSAAQAAAKDAYCMDCADAGPNAVEGCNHFLVAGDGGTGAGVGAFVELLNDTAAAKIEADCTSMCGPAAYELCSVGRACTYLPKTQCTSGLCK